MDNKILSAIPLLLLFGCTSEKSSNSNEDSTVSDDNFTDTEDTADSVDTQDSGTTQDTGDTNDTSDTNDTNDSGNPQSTTLLSIELSSSIVLTESEAGHVQIRCPIQLDDDLIFLESPSLSIIPSDGVIIQNNLVTFENTGS